MSESITRADTNAKIFIALATAVLFGIGAATRPVGLIICTVVLASFACFCWALVRERMLDWSWAALPSAFAIFLAVVFVVDLVAG